jgi:hypothetical protein
VLSGYGQKGQKRDGQGMLKAIARRNKSDAHSNCGRDENAYPQSQELFSVPAGFENLRKYG